MSLSPKHTTPFSVTDILSPIEETYKKTTIEAAIPPLTPYRTTQHPQTGMGGLGSMGVPVSNPYHNYGPALSHHTPPFTAQYGGELSHYGDPVRHSSTSWYGGNPDPRFASKYLRLYFTLGILRMKWIKYEIDSHKMKWTRKISTTIGDAYQLIENDRERSVG